MKGMLKKVISLMLIGALMLSFTACSDSRQVLVAHTNDQNITKITNYTYEPYGWANYNSKKNPNIEYEIVVGNVAWSLICSASLVIPVILTGWYLYEPVGPKIKDGNLKGVE